MSGEYEWLLIADDGKLQFKETDPLQFGGGGCTFKRVAALPERPKLAL
jgi:hypothetical protein